MKNIRCFLVLTLILTALPARAASDLTLFGAGQIQQKLSLQTASTAATTTTNFDPRKFGVFGLRYSHGKVLGAEHTFAYAPHFITGDTKAVIYNSDLMIQAPTPKAKPYLTAGLGTIFTFGTDSAGRPSLGKIGTKFALNYGGGLKVLPAGPVGVRFDIRGYTVPSVHLNLPTSPTATLQTQSQTLNFMEVGAGIIFAFGK